VGGLRFFLLLLLSKQDGAVGMLQVLYFELSIATYPNVRFQKSLHLLGDFSRSAIMSPLCIRAQVSRHPAENTLNVLQEVQKAAFLASPSKAEGSEAKRTQYNDSVQRNLNSRPHFTSIKDPFSKLKLPSLYAIMYM
jgi:hypothetical protein